MKTNNWMTTITGGALCLSLLACGSGKEKNDQYQDLYGEVSYERPEPAEKPEPYTQEGEASYYHPTLAGEPMANGEPYKPGKMTAAHKKLPLGTKVEVVNQENDSSVVLEITDRGPYAKDRIIDVSNAAARKLDFVKEGATEVEVEVVKPAPGHTIADSVPKKEQAAAAGNQ
jgi:rare lipoprotein A